MNDVDGVIKCTLKYEEIPLEIDGTRFVLREMSGQAKDEFLNSVKDRVKVEGGRIVGLKTYMGIHSNLLKRCVFDAEDKLVPDTEIQKWPAKMQRQLFERAQELNGLTPASEKAIEEEAKND